MAKVIELWGVGRRMASDHFICAALLCGQDQMTGRVTCTCFLAKVIDA